jgi:hypothetical protein
MPIKSARRDGNDDDYSELIFELVVPWMIFFTETILFRLLEPEEDDEDCFRLVRCDTGEPATPAQVEALRLDVMCELR